jgi:hypothetical protein
VCLRGRDSPCAARWTTATWASSGSPKILVAVTSAWTATIQPATIGYRKPTMMTAYARASLPVAAVGLARLDGGGRPGWALS